MGRIHNYKCKKCGFFFSDKNLHFCYDYEKDCIEEYMHLISTVGYGDDSPVKGRIVEKYCRNCDNTVRIYTINPRESLYNNEDSKNYLMFYIPKKREFLEKTMDFNRKLLEKANGGDSIDDIRLFVDDNSIYNMYEIDLDNYIRRKNKYRISKDDLENDNLHELNLAELTEDLNEIISQLEKELDYFDDLIICIHSLDDNYNLTLDGRKINTRACPKCGKEIFEVAIDKPCPKCKEDSIDYSSMMVD